MLLVDLGGVLFDFDHEHRLGQLGRLFGASPAQVESALWDSGVSGDADAGKYPTAADVRAEVRRITGYAGSDDDLDQAWCSAFRPATEVVELVAQAPVVRAVFTNNGPLEEEVLTRVYPHEFDAFNRLFFCHRLVANKPDPRVYRQVTQLLGVRPARIRFVDDGEDNVDAARRAGWTARVYRDINDLRALID
ncbi:MAG: HAD-IA family hydrolase [Mycobacteriaceae bacterium]|nr:HAD-IA family hydrolase [Mycobacteriaceae bacterium]